MQNVITSDLISKCYGTQAVFLCPIL